MLQNKVAPGLFLILLFLFPLINQAQHTRILSVPPIANNDSVLIGKNQVILIDVLKNDSDADDDVKNSTIQVVATPQLGIFSVLNNKIQYTPSTNVCGFDSIKYRLKDVNNELSNIATIYIEVTCFNLAPVAVNDQLTMLEDQTDSIDIFDNDRFTDGPDLNLTILNPPKHGIASINNSVMLYYTPNINFEGLDTLTYIFCDNDPTLSLCDTAFVFIQVNPINDPPEALNDTLYVYQLKSNTINLSSNDLSIDGPQMNYQMIVGPSFGIANIQSNGICNYTANNIVGSDSIQYEVCDLASPSLCDTAWLRINILPVFEKPIIKSDTLRVIKNSSNAINILINDQFPNGINSDSVFITFVSNIGIFNYNDSILNFSPNIDYVGTNTLIYYVKDLIDSTSNIAYITIYVNDIPVSNDLCELQCISNQSLSINPFSKAIAFNTPIDKSSIYIIKNSTNGTLTNYNPITESLNYVPNNGFVGKDSFQYVIYDNLGFASNPILVCIDVVNDIPVTAIPVISSNGDGINDYLTFEKIDDYPDNEVVVFDRYWNEVFRTKTYSSINFWDASNVNTGTYFYVTTIRLNGVEKIIKGYVNIIK